MDVQQVIGRWDAEEQAVRVRQGHPGTATPEQIVGRTGMKIFEAISSGELPPAPIGDTLDFVPIHMEPGAAVARDHDLPDLRSTRNNLRSSHAHS